MINRLMRKQCKKEENCSYNYEIRAKAFTCFCCFPRSLILVFLLDHSADVDEQDEDLLDDSASQGSSEASSSKTKRKQDTSAVLSQDVDMTKCPLSMLPCVVLLRFFRSAAPCCGFSCRATRKDREAIIVDG